MKLPLAVRCALTGAASLVALAATSWAGPPYVSDDPEPTDYRHYEIYLFNSGARTGSGANGESGIDFNYGGARDLQLTASLPISYQLPDAGRGTAGFGRAELAAKYRFLHQDAIGWDVAVFPRVFVPGPSGLMGERHATLFLPVWLERDWDAWSTFGGGGCALNRGDGARDFCLASWALVRRVLPNFGLGAEFVRQTADSLGGHPTTSIGIGARYDLSDTYHVLAYAGPGLGSSADAPRYSWYVSILLTF